MKKNLFDAFLRTLSKITDKEVTYTSGPNIQATNLATKSLHGFWYCGNVFDQGDIAYGVANNGTVEDFETNLVSEILKYLCSQKDTLVFYDVGANTGWYTMLASTFGSNTTVHSFEPIDEHLAILKETVLLNRKEDIIKLHNVALSNTNGTSTIRLAGTGSSLEKDFLSSDRGVQTITTKTLDTSRTDNPDFIKIDVEGHEYKVIQGGIGTIKSALPILFIEIAHTLKALGSNFIHADFDALFTTLNEFDYTPFIVKENTIKKYSPSKKEDGVYMFLFLHKDKHRELITKYSN